MIDRHTVYEVIDGERQYQDDTFGKDEPSIDALAADLTNYANKALAATSVPNSQATLHVFRKIAALAVKGMELYGAPHLEEY